MLNLVPELMQLSKSMKVSGMYGGGLNLTFTDPVPFAGNHTPANISGGLMRTDVHSSPGSISIDVSFARQLTLMAVSDLTSTSGFNSVGGACAQVDVDPTISVGGNVNFITTGMPSLPGLTGETAPAVPAPGPSRAQAKALELPQAAATGDAPSAAAVSPVLRPAASLYFDRGSRPSAADAETATASGTGATLHSPATDAAAPDSAAHGGSASPGLQQRQSPSPVPAEASLLSLSELLRSSQLTPSQPGAGLAFKPGEPAAAPSAVDSPADLAEVVVPACLCLTASKGALSSAFPGLPIGTSGYKLEESDHRNPATVLGYQPLLLVT